jgi:hypothetical protein
MLLRIEAYKNDLSDLFVSVVGSYYTINSE